MLNTEISATLKVIYDRTGLVIPDIFLIEEDGEMRKKWTVTGVFNHYQEKIYLRPKLFSHCNDIEYYTELLNRWNRQYNLPNATPEQVQYYMQEAEKQRVKDAQKTIIHECGHYLHWKYNYFKGLNIPYDVEHISKHARKNSRENFACAFVDYVLKTMPVESKRYQRVDSIIKDMQRKGCL